MRSVDEATGDSPIWKRSVLVFCFNRACLNSRRAQRGSRMQISPHTKTETQRPQTHTRSWVLFGRTEQLRSEKREALKRVRRAGGGQTSADKRQEKRTGGRGSSDLLCWLGVDNVCDSEWDVMSVCLYVMWLGGHQMVSLTLSAYSCLCTNPSLLYLSGISVSLLSFGGIPSDLCETNDRKFAG